MHLCRLPGQVHIIVYINIKHLKAYSLTIKTQIVMRQYNREVPDYADIFTVEEWNQSVKDGWFNNYDGDGYWVKDNMQCSDEVFSSQPEDATHVAWYNK